MYLECSIISFAEWVLCTMVHMDLALEEGGESQGQGHHSTEAEERIREVIWGNNFTTTRTDLLRCGLTTWRMSSRRFAGLSQTSPMLPWTLSFLGSWQDPSESSSQHQTISIRWVTDSQIKFWSFYLRSSFFSCWDATLTFWKSFSLALPSSTRKEKPLRGFAHGR